MATTLVYNGTTFTDATIIAGQMVRAKSPLSDTLTYDTLSVKILDRSGVEDFLIDVNEIELQDSNEQTLVFDYAIINYVNFVRGTSCDLWHDGEYLGKYYIDSVVRNTRREYTLNFISALGVLDSIAYYGGIYARRPCGEIIADIMGGTYASQDNEYEYYTGAIPFYIQKQLKNVIVSGWIPYTNSGRDALQQILFAVGGSVLKADNGLLKFSFWQPTAAMQIPASKLYSGGSIEYPSKYTKVIVTEHEYRQTSVDKQVELFDTQGVTVDHKVIVFDKPCYGLASSALTIHESGANYAIVSGLGVLTGKEYTHNTMLVEKLTGIQGKENVAQIQNAYLVSSLNSINVAERVAAYYGFADIVKYGVVLEDDLQVGNRVAFTDPFGDEVTGYIVSEEITLSNTLKSQTQFATNWQPNHQGNAYNRYTILSSGTSWTVPSELVGTPARVVIFGGFEGGQGGYNGANGGRASGWYPRSTGGTGGNGGLGGNGGSKVYINTLDITSLANSYSYTLGVGGQGGTNGALGSIGTNSVFNGSTSADGQLNTTGWANPIDGTIYNDSTIATKGTNGGKGGNGGSANGKDSNYQWIITNGENGENCGSHTGGIGAETFGNAVGCNTGGGGGGASIDSNGANGIKGAYYPTTTGSGGNGASVTTVLSQATLGQCGKGGAGGGGGGGGGFWFTLYDSDDDPPYVGDVGTGGTGQKGQQGSNGFVLIMHN